MYNIMLYIFSFMYNNMENPYRGSEAEREIKTMRRPPRPGSASRRAGRCSGPASPRRRPPPRRRGSAGADPAASIGLGRIVAFYHLLILFISESLIESVPLFLKRQCGRTLGEQPAFAGFLEALVPPSHHTMRLEFSGSFAAKRLAFSIQAL